MNYWKEETDSHIRLGETDIYQTYPCVSGRININGYIDSPLMSSDVIYMGSCDIMSSILYPEKRWCELLHKERNPSLPLIAIGSSAAGLPSTIRRLYSYIQIYGPPKKLYLSVARFEGYEYVNKSGLCYNVNSRAGTPRFLKKRNLLTNEEFNIWNLQTDVYKQMYNIHNNEYLLEERFAFIETLCRLHNIELKWTFNLSDACIVALYKNISIFKNISNFMKESFVGLVEIKDNMQDRSMGIETHFEIYKKFI